MRHSQLTIALLFLTVMTACGGPGEGDADAPPAGDSLAAPPVPAAPDTPPDSAQAAGAAGAVAVLRDYYAAVRDGDYARAYRLWSGEGEASGQTLEEFGRGYADTRSVSVAFGTPGRVEGAAGSRYVEVPATVRAETRAGARQCFQGVYVLRRAEVPGATEEQRAWRIHSASLREAPSAACDDGAPSVAADSAAAVIRELGARLASVSLLAPPEVLRGDIRTQYGPLVTEELLEEWLANPSAAPGREVSSPWPDRIEIRTLEGSGDDGVMGTGEVVYVTSTGPAPAAGEEITFEVVRTGEGWRIRRLSGR